MTITQLDKQIGDPIIDKHHEFLGAVLPTLSGICKKALRRKQIVLVAHEGEYEGEHLYATSMAPLANVRPEVREQINALQRAADQVVVFLCMGGLGGMTCYSLSTWSPRRKCGGLHHVVKVSESLPASSMS